MATYAFYQGEYYGNQIPTADFDRCAARAKDYLVFLEREYTVTGDECAHDKAVCAIAEAMFQNDQAVAAAMGGDDELAGVTVGSVSESYRAANPSAAGIDLTEKGMSAQYYKIARKYLTIYRGVR